MIDENGISAAEGSARLPFENIATVTEEESQSKKTRFE
jgi:hypothetical protein